MKLSVLNQVRVSTGATASEALRDSIRLARLADDLGYERYWIAEHHGSPGTACPCPEVMLGLIGAETSRIRIGAGGILLPHYSPLKVAECFCTLDNLYPGRVDLGIFFFTGAGVTETSALQRHRCDAQFGKDFEDQLTELLGFVDGTFPDEHPFKNIVVSPRARNPIPVWLLGASQASAALAATFGLPYAFAQFICPQLVESSCRKYQAEWSGERIEGRRLILAVSVVCVETEAELRQLAAAARRDRPPAIAGTPAASHPVRPGYEWQRSRFVGTPEKVRADMCAAAAAAGVDELMVLTALGDYDMCERSYRMLADAFDLTPR